MSNLTQYTANIAVTNIKRSLKTLQDHVIGFFRHRNSDDWLPVIEYKDRYVRMLNITKTYGTVDNSVHETSGELKLFPEGKTMDELLTKDYQAWKEYFNSL